MQLNRAVPRPAAVEALRNEWRFKASVRNHKAKEEEMTGPTRVQFDSIENVHATSRGFCRIFTEGMQRLYTLALLLTADHAKAEECFLAGLADSIDGSGVDNAWADSWARRSIVKNAIRAVLVQDTRRGVGSTQSGQDVSLVRGPLAFIVRLAPVERLVFVMSVLERYSDAECAALLSLTREAVEDARVQAMGGIRFWESHLLSSPTTDFLVAS